MTSISKFVPWLVAMLFVALAARAQEVRYFVPEKVERATKADDQGLLQWDKYEPPKCGSCQGTGKQKCPTCERFPDEDKNCPECKRVESRECPCRTCAGVGHMPDPLEKSFCPGCHGTSFLLCLVCKGRGVVKTQDAPKAFDCPACRGPGAWKCGVCDGNRLVEVAVVKPALKDANVASLTKMLEATDKAIAGLATFTPSGKNSRKDVKELVKQLQLAQQISPPLKRVPKVLEDYMSKIYAGANFQGHEHEEAHAMQSIQQSTDYYLKLQKRTLQLALARAEANAKVEAENKPK